MCVCLLPVGYIWGGGGEGWGGGRASKVHLSLFLYPQSRDNQYLADIITLKNKNNNVVLHLHYHVHGCIVMPQYI